METVFEFLPVIPSCKTTECELGFLSDPTKCQAAGLFSAPVSQSFLHPHLRPVGHEQLFPVCFRLLAALGSNRSLADMESPLLNSPYEWEPSSLWSCRAISHFTSSQELSCCFTCQHFRFFNGKSCFDSSVDLLMIVSTLGAVFSYALTNVCMPVFGNTCFHFSYSWLQEWNC